MNSYKSIIKVVSIVVLFSYIKVIPAFFVYNIKTLSNLTFLPQYQDIKKDILQGTIGVTNDNLKQLNQVLESGNAVVLNYEVTSEGIYLIEALSQAGIIFTQTDHIKSLYNVNAAQAFSFSSTFAYIGMKLQTTINANNKPIINLVGNQVVIIPYQGQLAFTSMENSQGLTLLQKLLASNESLSNLSAKFIFSDGSQGLVTLTSDQIKTIQSSMVTTSGSSKNVNPVTIKFDLVVVDGDWNVKVSAVSSDNKTIGKDFPVTIKLTKLNSKDVIPSSVSLLSSYVYYKTSNLQKQVRMPATKITFSLSQDAILAISSGALPSAPSASPTPTPAPAPAPHYVPSSSGAASRF